MWNVLTFYTIFTLSIGDRQTLVNSVDPDQMLHAAASNQGLHCLPLMQQFLDISRDNIMFLFKF